MRLLTPTFTFLGALLLVAVTLLPPAAPPASAQQPLYILPILDGTVTDARVQDVQTRLGTVGSGGVVVGFSGVYRYMAEVEGPDERDEDPDIHFKAKMEGLERIANVAKATNAPFLVHLNGGRWAGGGPLVDRLMSDPRLMAWSARDEPWSYPKDGEYHFSLGSYNELVRRYKKRNLQLAARWLADFKAGPDGHLLVGVSTDSEVLINTHPWYDYNPIVLEEFTHWLQGGEIYDDDGRWKGEGLNLGLSALNRRWGTNYARWRDVTAPREPSDSQAWKDWLTFRNLLVDHNVQEQVDWMREAGLTTVTVYAHQSPALDADVAADTLASAQVNGGGTGITTYGQNAGSAELFEKVRAYGAPWGIFEYNPRTENEGEALAALENVRQFGASIICPYHWDDFGGENEVGYTIRGTAFERALKTFVERSGTAGAPRSSSVTPTQPADQPAGQPATLDLFAWDAALPQLL